MLSCPLHSGQQIRPSCKRHRVTAPAALKVGSKNRFSRYHEDADSEPKHSKKKAAEKAPKGNKPEPKSSKKLSKGTRSQVLVTEDEDGSVLFHFEPNLKEALAHNQAYISPGRQHKTLEKVVLGGEFDFQLWDTSIHREAATTAGTAEQLSDAAESADTQQQNGAGLESQASSVQQNGASLDEQQTGASLKKQQSDVSQDGSILEATSDGDGEHAPSSQPVAEAAASTGHEQPSPIGNGAASMQTQESLPTKKSQSASLPRPAKGPFPGPRRKPIAPDDESASLHDVAQRLAKDPPQGEETAQRPVELPPKSLTGPGMQDQVPCYLWHESSQPTPADLQEYLRTNAAHGEEDESVETTDSLSSDADSSAMISERAQPLLSALGRLFNPVWRPVWQSVLWLWRTLPFWLRKRFGAARQQVPEMHASPVLTQHMMTEHTSPFQPVPGSTFDLTTGRSLTPLIDLARHQVENLVGTGIKNVNLYRTALTVKNAVPGNVAISDSYDRLECLGDAVVGLVFRSWVFNRFPNDDDGSMTNTTQTLVSNRAALLYAMQLNLSSYIAQNLRYMRPNLRVPDDVLADVFEALVGALYLDRGVQAANDFVIRVAEGAMGLSNDLASYRNYKLYLHNNLKQRSAGVMQYSCRRRKSVWVCKCRLHGKLVGIGLDHLQRSKAETAAAFAAMDKLGFAVEPEYLKKVYGSGKFPGHSRQSTQPS